MRVLQPFSSLTVISVGVMPSKLKMCNSDVMWELYAALPDSFQELVGSPFPAEAKTYWWKR